MTALADGPLRWAVEAAAPGAAVAGVRGLREGGSPWLLRLERDGRALEVVLRVGGDPALLRTEVAALELAAASGLPAPGLLAADLAGRPPLVLIERLAGSSAIPAERPPERLRALGRAAAAIHAVAIKASGDLPWRRRPISSVDFAALRRHAPARPLLEAAEAAVAGPPPAGPTGLVHGDLWQGNALWAGERLSGLVDWDCAGAGPAGVDLGSVRCDAALCFGLDAAGDVLAGWEEAAGRPAADLAHWDTVAGLSSPPDLGWFVAAIADQGRPDLTRELLIERRDAFLRDALRRLGS